MRSTDQTDSVAERALRQLGALFAGAIRSDGRQHHWAEVSFLDLKHWSAVASWGLGDRPVPDVQPHEVVAFADVIRGAVLPLTVAGLEMGIARLKDTVRQLADGKTTFDVVAHDARLLLELMLRLRTRFADAGLVDEATELGGVAENATEAICRAIEAAERR